MNMEGNTMERKGWLAAVMGMTMPGMGQIYNGELIKGVSFLAIFLALFASGFRWVVLLPDRLLIGGALATIIMAAVVFVMIIVDAHRTAKSLGAGFQLKPYNRWYFYLAIWLLGSILVSGSVYGYVKKDIIEAYKIVTRCMEPAVLSGDRLFADKTAYRRMPPKKGDIILFIHPDDRSKILVRSIAGLPGDAVTTSDGRKERVPHGMIYVLGVEEQSVDSKLFGFVPLKDVIGKARQIYYSSGDEGVRWDRVGKTLNGSVD